MSFLAAMVLQTLLPQAQDPGDDGIPQDELLVDQLQASDDAVAVELVSKAGEPELLDVVSHGAPAFEVLARIAAATGRKLKLDPGDAALCSHRGVDVHLKRRPLREAATWVAGAAGLTVELTRDQLRCGADRPETMAPEEALTRAIDTYRATLLRDPTHPDAPRLRFEIGNALFQLGDFAGATAAYHDLERDAPEFGDMPFAYLRCGEAHARLGDEEGAQSQWLSIAQTYPRSPLVAPARLAAVRSFRRQKDEKNASVVLRLVVEGMQGGLAPADLVDAGELLNEGGSYERAIDALQWALQSSSDPDVEERGLVQLARAQAGRNDRAGVIATAERYVKRFPAGRRGAEIQWRLAQAHRELGDPFTALLALRRARELRPDASLELRCDLLEGTIYAECGVTRRAEPCLSRAGACNLAEIATPALTTLARLSIEGGQFEGARHFFDRLASFPGHEVDAAVGRAEVSLLQHNYKLCLQEVNATLPRSDDAQRARLLELADQALRNADPSELADAFAPPAAPAPAPAAPAPAAPSEPDDER